MNCRCFERQVADWLGERLPPEQARRMAAHQEICASCAGAARAEGQLRSRWREGYAAEPAGDVWPQLAARLVVPRGRDVWNVAAARSPRWVFSGAAFLMVVTVFVCGVRPLGTVSLHTRSGPTGSAPPRTLEVAPPQVNVVNLAALSDVGQVNPVVDDPVGTNMEDVWLNIKASRKINGR